MKTYTITIREDMTGMDEHGGHTYNSFIRLHDEPFKGGYEGVDHMNKDVIFMPEEISNIVEE